LKRCRHCRIIFLTHPRNASRDDIDCPFGCRQAHRKENSTKRSCEYYQTPEGKEKKKGINARRKGQDKIPPLQILDKTMILHLQVVTSLIEKRSVALADIFLMVENILRQHSIVISEKSWYEGRYPNKSPP
jgi:hypothetical protein